MKRVSKPAAAEPVMMRKVEAEDTDILSLSISFWKLEVEGA